MNPATPCAFTYAFTNAVLTSGDDVIVAPGTYVINSFPPRSTPGS